MALESSYNEKSLLAQVATGDESAFTILFQKFYPKVYQVGMMLCRSQDQAEELVQDVFLKIWLRREQLTAINDFASYLFMMTRNQAYQQLQRDWNRKKVLQTIQQGMPVYSNETDETIISNNYKRIMEEAVSHLPYQQQQVYRLSKIEGMKRDEVADKLKIQPNTVKEYLSLAVKNIRAYFIANSDLLPAGAILVLSLWLQVKNQ